MKSYIFTRKTSLSEPNFRMYPSSPPETLNLIGNGITVINTMLESFVCATDGAEARRNPIKTKTKIQGRGAAAKSRRPSIETRNARRKSLVHIAMSRDAAWTEQADASLMAAVFAVAEWSGIKMPRQSDLQMAWEAGSFANEHAAIFWARVAHDMHPVGKEACFHRYHRLLNLRIARFT